MTNEGTTKVIDKVAVGIIIVGIIGSLATFVLFTITLVIAMADQDLFSSTVLFVLTLFHFGMSCMLIPLLGQHLTDKKYFKEIKVSEN